MDLNDLTDFLTVAETHNMTLAAEKLNVSQPALSRRIKNLEFSLNTILFDRTSRQLELTHDGKLFRMRAEEILQIEKKAINELHPVGSDISGDIYIGCAETGSLIDIIRVTKTMLQKHANLRFHFIDGNYNDLINQMNDGILDFCFFAEPIDLSSCNYITVNEEPWGVILQSDNPLAKKEFLTINDLRDLPLVFTNQELTPNEFSGWSNDTFKDMKIVATTNLPYSALLMASEGIGAFLAFPGVIKNLTVYNLCYIPLFPAIKSKTMLAWKKNSLLSNQAQAYVDELKRAISIE